MGRISLTLPFSLTGAKAGKTTSTITELDEAATNQKEENETESNSDPETTPLAVNDPTQLVEEPEQKRLELIATTEACDDETLEDVTKTKGDKPEEVSTDVSMKVDGREGVLWASLQTWVRAATGSIRMVMEDCQNDTIQIL